MRWAYIFIATAALFSIFSGNVHAERINCNQTQFSFIFLIDISRPIIGKNLSGDCKRRQKVSVALRKINDTLPLDMHIESLEVYTNDTKTPILAHKAYDFKYFDSFFASLDDEKDTLYSTGDALQGLSNIISNSTNETPDQEKTIIIVSDGRSLSQKNTEEALVKLFGKRIPRMQIISLADTDEEKESIAQLSKAYSMVQCGTAYSIMPVHVDELIADESVLQHFAMRLICWRRGSSPSILFDKNSAVLEDFYKAWLPDLGASARRGYCGIILSGHACATDEEEDSRLSERRAQAVKALLMETGVPERLIYIRAYGTSRQRYDTGSIEGCRMNRRVDIEFIELRHAAKPVEHAEGSEEAGASRPLPEDGAQAR